MGRDLAAVAGEVVFAGIVDQAVGTGGLLLQLEVHAVVLGHHIAAGGHHGLQAVKLALADVVLRPAARQRIVPVAVVDVDPGAVLVDGKLHALREGHVAHDPAAVQALHVLLVLGDHLQDVLFPLGPVGAEVVRVQGVLQDRAVLVHEGEVQARAVLRAVEEGGPQVIGKVQGVAGVIHRAVHGDLVERDALVQDRIRDAAQVHVRDDVGVRHDKVKAFLDHHALVIGPGLHEGGHLHPADLFTGGGVVGVIVAAEEGADVPEGHALRALPLQEADQV